MSVAGLPMYDMAPLRPAVDVWWAGLARSFRREGIAEVPDKLERGLKREAIWTHPELLLGQTCGYPLLFDFAGRFRLVARPSYRAPGAGEGRYCSVVVVPEAAATARLEELRGARAAYNDKISHSGMNVFRYLVAPLARDGRFFGQVIESGGHLQSLALVREGQADVAAIDCVTHALLARHMPELVAGTRVLLTTVGAPALPYITRVDAADDLVRRLRAGLARAVADPDLAEARDAILLEDFRPAALADYAPIAEMAEAAARAGYPVLA